MANGRGPSIDLLGSLGLSYPDLPEDEHQEPADTSMDAKVREVAARARAQAPVIIRRLESVEAAPSEAKGASRLEQADPAPVSSSPPPAEESVRSAVPPPATAAARRPPRGTAQIEAAWRRDAIVEWVRDQGEATLVDIRDHFDLGNASNDVSVLLRAGLLERTGAKRPSPRKGPPSPVLRVAETEDFTSHAPMGSDEAAQQAASGTPDHSEPVVESPAGTAVAADRSGEHGGISREDAAADGREAAASDLPAYLTAKPFELPLYQPAGTAPSSQDVVTPALTVHQELTVRYVRTLIGWIERASIVHEGAPPEHVFDRIERLLGIEDGVA